MKNDAFQSLGLGAELCRALTQIGYKTPTPIQAQTIPELLAGRDVLGIAQTGTGKTAAFALPLLARMAERGVRARPKQPHALILAPTRELALQIGEELDGFGRHLKLRHAVIFGGVGQHPQVQALARGLDILVATPGRLLDLIGQGFADLSRVGHLVLDEADRLLDMGFVRDVRRLVSQTPRARQSLLFSATMPAEVSRLATEILTDPVRIDVSPKAVTVEKIDQRVVMVDNADKRRVLETLLRGETVSRAMVFCRTKHGANRVAKQLNAAGIGAEAIHGNKSQSARQRALAQFKNGQVWVLVATDIAARGIDVDAVSHVINFELPHEPEGYVHRIGRTGRAGAAGVAWSLCDPAERPRLEAIEKLIRLVPQAYDDRLEPIARAAARSNGHTVNGDGQRKPRRRRRRSQSRAA